MGILTCLDSRPRLAFPGTPPELVSPSSSTYSSRPSEAALPSPPPMSSYEQPTAELLRGKSPEDSRQSPREQQQRQQQQQQQLPQPPQQQQQPQQQERQVLPPLSSILTLTQDGRPLHSPVSEGRRAYSATASPLDRPHTSSASSSSYFPSSAATAAAAAAAPLPRLRAGPFEPRLDERPSLFQPLSRDPFPRPPLSPQSRDGEPTHQQQQQQYRPSSAADRGSDYGPPPPLPALHQRGEYSPHSGRAQLERYPAPLTGVKREADQMSGHHHHHHHYQQQQHTQQLQRAPSIHHHHHHAAPPPPPPPTPPAGAMVVVVASSSSSSSSSSEGGMPSKDGLGPKIWTGTHFLPRFVRAAEVPGEGTCYFYDDGSHCKAVIDGEQVNAHWGVTKAGKPRKRLAIACITCREKKIKCDPDYPRCVQCEKFGRVCKFKNAPPWRQQHLPINSPRRDGRVEAPGRQHGEAAARHGRAPAGQQLERLGLAADRAEARVARHDEPDPRQAPAPRRLRRPRLQPPQPPAAAAPSAALVLALHPRAPAAPAVALLAPPLPAAAPAAAAAAPGREAAVARHAPPAAARAAAPARPEGRRRRKARLAPSPAPAAARPPPHPR
ncbi:hypothetical protein, variant [Gaeumannomyces tritici R3-111a-1]|uniref:Zn(2)-C6 fungal-type domain-containing protein n=1 Tax=Gaeumannomyces tritici (strain R3-111a-1) TaxID=644352 RepID=J3NGV4_GAET3|nr:hypothetical protein, variant [Gaeumannomyces tritici R3-111a-1]EJT80493.1 hypothetical protein, variant [Gaeumannomyces tritici R3-111a-1]